jgi:hypothetical protein
MSKFYGICRSPSSLLIEEIDDTREYEKFSYIVEIEYGYARNGNGDFFTKIYTQGKFEEITSGQWKVNPLINCSYNWTCKWACIDVIDVDMKNCSCRITIDYRTIFKRSDGEKEGIRNVFRFIDSLKDYLNVEHYVLFKKIEKTLGEWEFYNADVILQPEKYSEATDKLIEIYIERDRLQRMANQPNVLNNLEDPLSQLHEKYNQFIGGKRQPV